MVGVPDFARCVCGPSIRTVCPIFFAASQRISPGPRAKDTKSAVIAASTVRSVM